MFGALDSLPSAPLAPYPTPVEQLSGLHAALGGPRLLVKRDDAIAFGGGGNKVRKLRLMAADALRQGSDTLITCGGVQSNHARATAATAAKLGLRCVLIANGSQPERPTANALLARLFGADMRYVATRADREPAMDAAAAELRRVGRVPYVIPLGASTPLGACAFVQAIAELAQQIEPPDLIVHATSSGGTQAGLVAGCALAGWPTRVVGISADESSAVLQRDIRGILTGVGPLLGFAPERFAAAAIEVDDRFVGDGYGIPTPESQEALEMTARSDAVILDPTYTSKAMAAVIAAIRGRELREPETVLFWHTGGQIGLFA
jgi:1-aminocyclopropane-1-carboxylate deaminase/D-cysteine desulfhydrase-like pyridoxal-dependent ACC family enzyme